MAVVSQEGRPFWGSRVEAGRGEVARTRDRSSHESSVGLRFRGGQGRNPGLLGSLLGDPGLTLGFPITFYSTSLLKDSTLRIGALK